MGLAHPSPQNRLGRLSRRPGVQPGQPLPAVLGQGEGQAPNLKVEAVASW